MNNIVWPRLNRRAFLRLALWSAAGLIAGCRSGKNGTGAPETEGAPDLRRGGTLTVAMAADAIVTLDPAAYSDRATETVVRNLFDGLVTRTHDNRVVPELAEAYRWVDDVTVEFALKRGVTFHNGAEMTADDVVFTFERILHQDVGAPRRGFIEKVRRVEKVDDATVRFTLDGPWPLFMQMLVHNQIVPQAYVNRVGDAGFAAQPVGTGPFQWVEGDLAGSIVLERFDGYYGGAAELAPVAPPFLDRVIFEMLPDLDARIDALLAGSAHIAQSVSAARVPELIDVPGVAVQTTVGTKPKFIDLNVTRPPFDDVRVRQAMNYAVDVPALLAGVAGGYGILLPGPLSPANFYADPTLEPYGHDLDAARTLLAEAGYQPDDIAFTLDAYGPYVEIAEAVAAQLRQVGMDVAVEVWEYSEVKPLLLDCQRQAFLRDWGDSAFDPVGYIEAKWQTRVPGTSAGRGNFACYSNPRLDELIEAGAIESDPEVRATIYAEAQRIIYNEAPAVFLYVPQEVTALSTRVHNWMPSPDGRINLHDAWLSGTAAE